MSDTKNIYQRINAVMGDCDYLQKKQMQQGKGIRYDEVMAMIRPLLIKHGIVMAVRQTAFENISGIEGTKQKIYQGYYEMDLVNMDNPEEKVTHTVYAHGMDGGDKAPGKAHTYATKLMLVKGFGIETGEDEESRAEKMDRFTVINDTQAAELKEMLSDEVDGVKGWSKSYKPFLRAYRIGSIPDLPASKFDEVVAKIKGK